MNAQSSLQALSATALLWLASALLVAGPASDLIKKGDAFDRKLQPAEALQCYLPAEKLQPQNVQLLVSIARQYRHLMTDATKQEEKIRLGRIALDYSQRAAALGPKDSNAQLDIGITYGKMLTLLSSKEQVQASGRIKDAATRAIELDPNNDTAWHILGRWHRVLADVSLIKRTLAPLFYGKLPTTKYEDAVVCFQRAIEINPNRLMHYVELGRVYAQMGRKDEARRFIDKGLAMPDAEKDDPETKERGREALKKL